MKGRLENLLKAKTPRSRIKPSPGKKPTSQKSNGSLAEVDRQQEAAASAAPGTNRVASSAIVGFVDRFSPGVIEGWALDRFDISRQLSVRATVDKTEIGTANCNLYRKDVHMTGAGDGRYGFRIEYPGPQLLPERTVVAVIETDPPHRLPISPNAQIAIPPQHPKGVTYIGFVEQVSAGELVGWALDRSDLSKRPKIRATSNGKLLCNAYCNIFREDLFKSGAGDGRYGFRIPLDPSLMTSEITIAVDDTAAPFIIPFTPNAEAALKALWKSSSLLQTSATNSLLDRTTAPSHDTLEILKVQVQELQAEIMRFKGALNLSIRNLAEKAQANDELGPLMQEIGCVALIPPEHVSWRARGIYRQLLHRLGATT